MMECRGSLNEIEELGEEIERLKVKKKSLQKQKGDKEIESYRERDNSKVYKMMAETLESMRCVSNDEFQAVVEARYLMGKEVARPLYCKYYCPNCGRYVQDVEEEITYYGWTHIRPNYCCWCGQRIKQEDEV